MIIKIKLFFRVYLSSIFIVSGMSICYRAVLPVFVLMMVMAASVQAAALGSHKYVTLLFRFASNSDTPKQKSYFEGLIVDNTYPSANHYFREVSYNRMNIDGSTVYGWYDLPRMWHEYTYLKVDENGDLVLDENGDPIPFLDVDKLLVDGLYLVDADVYFPDYAGINIMLNEDPLTAPFASNRTLTYDGVTKGYHLTFQGPWGFNRMDVTTHEMMHTIGLSHSSGAYDAIYDSQWDRMSGSTCPPTTPHPVYGCLGVHTIAWHKLLMGWIDPDRNFATGSSGAGIVNIERLAFPPFAFNNYLMAELNIPGTGLFYTVEYRYQIGYDETGAIPGDAVIIHYVDPSLDDRKAQVVDLDNPNDNENPNDDGAMWIPGETFQSGTGIIVHVESMDTERAVVSVSNQARDPVYTDKANSGFEDGTAANPWNTVAEAYASVTPSGNVYIKPGSYNETLIMSKPGVIDRWGSSGEVTIGQ